MALRANLELMLRRGQDSPLLRFSLGSECLKQADFLAAIEHLRKAIEQNRNYSAAWKLLGRAYAEAGSTERAARVFEEGIAVAMEHGDVQAAKEMQVFLRRLGTSPSDLEPHE